MYILTLSPYILTLYPYPLSLHSLLSPYTLSLHSLDLLVRAHETRRPHSATHGSICALTLRSRFEFDAGITHKMCDARM